MSSRINTHTSLFPTAYEHVGIVCWDIPMGFKWVNEKTKALKQENPNFVVTLFTLKSTSGVLEDVQDIDQIICLSANPVEAEFQLAELRAEHEWKGWEYFSSSQKKINPKRILLGQLGSYGDCLYATSVAAQIKRDYPESHLTWAIGSIYVDAITNNPFVDEVWEVPISNPQDMPRVWADFTKDVEKKQLKETFDEVFLTQINPGNFKNYDGTVRSSIFRGYPKPITIPVHPVVRLLSEEVVRAQKFVQEHRLFEEEFVIIFEWESRSQQSFVDEQYAVSVAKTITEKIPHAVVILAGKTRLPYVADRVIDGSVLSVRELAEITHWSHLLLGVSSGISWMATSTWAKNIPKVQLLRASTSMYASMAYDARNFGLPADTILEIQDCRSSYVSEIVQSIYCQGFQEARRRYHVEIPIDFTFYLEVIEEGLIRHSQWNEVLESIKHTLTRFGANWQIRDFLHKRVCAGLQKEWASMTLQRQSTIMGHLKDLHIEWSPFATGAPSPISKTTIKQSPGIDHSGTQPTPFYKVTAIVSIFRAERFMQGILDDLLRQTLGPELEIVIIDAASDENERSIIEQYQMQNENIQYVRTGTRVGIYEAWNLGANLARGQYITNANADDRHRPDAFEKMVEILEGNPSVALVYANVAVTENENEVLETATVSGEFRWPDFDPQLLFQVCYIGPQPMWRKELHKRYGYFDPTLKSAGDYEFWLRICRHERFVHLSEILGLYLLSSSGMEHGNQSLSHRESEISRNRYWPSEWGIRPSPMGSFFVKNHDISEPKTMLRNDALVSIIMPTCNRPHMLLLALDSILKQTYENWEVIIVNDGGEDVGSLLSTIDVEGRFVYVRLPKKHERSYARNVGITLAKGKYIAYLDDDDKFLPDHLETLVTCLENSNYETAYTDSYRVFHEKMNGRYVEKRRDVPYSYEFCRDRLLQENFIPILCVMHLRSCFDRIGMFDESLNTHEDWDLWIRMSEGSPFHHINKVTAEFSWRMDGSSTTSSRQDDFVATKARIHDRYGIPSSGRLENVSSLQEWDTSSLEVKAKTFDCSIIIPVFNKVELTQQCLTHLAEVTDTPSYEVIVVDNCSSDGTAEFLASLSGDIQVITNNENRGFAKACNQGARAAKGKHLVFLNNDTIPRAGWLSALVEEIELHESVGVVGSKLLYPDDTIQHAGVVISRLYRTPYHLFQGVSGSFPAVNTRREFQAVTAACMLVRKETFESVSGFDEGFVNGFEDVDLCLKTRQIGKKVIYQPKSCLYHLESQTPGRKDHDRENAKRFIARWEHQWLDDEDLVADQSGCFIRQEAFEGKIRSQLISKQTMAPPAAWQRVVDLQQLLLGRTCQSLVEMTDSQKIGNLLVPVESWPNDIGILEWVGRVCESLHCEQEAVQFWQKLLAIADHPKARLGLARAMLKNGNLDESQKHLDEWKRKFPQREDGWTLQGILFMQREKFFEAKEAFDQSLAFDGVNIKAQVGLGMACLGLEQPAEAWEQFERVLSVDPDNVRAIRCLIQAGTALQQWDILERHLTRFVERNPADCDIRFALAGVQCRTGQVEKANEHLTWLRLIQPEYEGLNDLEAMLGCSQSKGSLVATT
jgi:GT2 family glycosyltransferase/ADP-heptose:LPS heptosyltransferase/Tfp pilus assembly protein PilF